MAIKKIDDEVGQRKVFKRDALGRFARIKPIKPLPVNMKPQVSKWSTEDETNGLESLLPKFNKIQVKINPKKDCKDVFEEVHRLLIASGGMLSKVIDRTTNKPYGFLVRIPSSTNPNVVFMRFTKINPYNLNTYFQKTNAIVSTLICGERWLEKRAKYGYALENIPFEIFYKEATGYLVIDDDGITSVRPTSPNVFVQGRRLNEAEREGYTLSNEMIYYINRFEQKAQDYYKNNKNNKYFVALPFN